LKIDPKLGISAWDQVAFRFYLRDFDFFERIASALDQLQRLHEGESPEAAEIRRAVDTGGLVLVESSFVCYWGGKQVVQNWNRAHMAWQLLWMLARAAREGRTVGPDDLYPEKEEVSPSTMASRWHRLDPLLPSSLSSLVEPMGRNRGYRLRLPCSQITLFE
jgi:hypothetical protein